MSNPSQASTNRPEPLSYLLTQIAMRQMLGRCTSSVSKSHNGQLTYAPVVAAELEAQLHQWYDLLPDTLRFKPQAVEEGFDLSPNAVFLSVQYYACLASIYWPAVYQATCSEWPDEGLSTYCRKFFESYISFVPAAVSSMHGCPPNAWTIYAR